MHAHRVAVIPTESGPEVDAPGRHRGTIVLSSVSSDAHTWNLVYLELLLEEAGFAVVNLGPCVPDDLLWRECLRHRPVAVVLSTVNGHGARDGARMVRTLREDPALRRLPAVIGGKLGVQGRLTPAERDRLLAAGFQGVYEGSDVTPFLTFLRRVSQNASDRAAAAE
ncbi:cobalamin B12-binding domain-containing protein [Micromonospora sp. CA-240977]|uniref:cobalamin B12-binding domain-containing protein n=1 Tax=Micromonospora sp. CA-240977 TaxID=3239957 RepID=UPI003D918ACE